MNKESARAYLKSQLESLSKELQAQKSEVISACLRKELTQFKTEEIGVYAPTLHEVHWQSELEKDAVFLFCRFDQKHQMDFYPGRFSELEECKVWNKTYLMPKILGQAKVPKVLIIPGLGFTPKGERLGRGKGYFDRYLENFKGLKIGLCFKVQLMDELPTDPHDQKMDWIVTEEGILKLR